MRGISPCDALLERCWPPAPRRELAIIPFTAFAPCLEPVLVGGMPALDALFPDLRQSPFPAARAS